MFSGALASLLDSVEARPLATLYLNQNSPLIRRLAEHQDAALLQSIVRVLYMQALMAGGHPLRGTEMNVMNQELLQLVELASGAGKE